MTAGVVGIDSNEEITSLSPYVYWSLASPASLPCVPTYALTCACGERAKSIALVND